MHTLKKLYKMVSTLHHYRQLRWARYQRSPKKSQHSYFGHHYRLPSRINTMFGNKKRLYVALYANEVSNDDLCR